jgi:hypothetical protein
VEATFDFVVRTIGIATFSPFLLTVQTNMFS